MPPRDIIITPSTLTKSSVMTGSSILIVLRPKWEPFQGRLKDLADILHDLYPSTAVTIRVAWELAEDSMEIQGFRNRQATEDAVTRVLASWYLSLGEDMDWVIDHDATIEEAPDGREAEE